MSIRYEDVYAEMIEVVPELPPSYWIVEVSKAEWELKNSGQPYSQADLEHIQEVAEKNPESEKAQEGKPLPYLIFEDDLWHLIVEYAGEPTHRERLTEIMAWLERLAVEGDDRVKSLVHMTICENIVDSSSLFVEQIFPLIGERMRQWCIECIPLFTSEERLNASSRNDSKPETEVCECPYPLKNPTSNCPSTANGWPNLKRRPNVR